MNYEIEKGHDWLLANKLSVHYVDKSMYMLINQNINISFKEVFELKMGNYILSRTKTYRYLGLVVDEKFSWSNHIDEICWILASDSFSNENKEKQTIGDFFFDGLYKGSFRIEFVGV